METPVQILSIVCVSNHQCVNRDHHKGGFVETLMQI